MSWAPLAFVAVLVVLLKYESLLQNLERERKALIAELAALKGEGPR